MVFYRARKRPRRHVSKQNPPAGIADLPEEVLLKIIPDLDTPSILHLRLTCKHVVQSCNTVLSKQVTTLYLHPRTIERAISICQHPVFGEEIEHIVLLGNTQWREIEKAYPGYRKYGRINSLYGSRYHEYWDIRFRPWPIDALTRRNEPSRQLIRALSALPKLRKLSFAEKGWISGWNQSQQSIIDAHAHRSGVTSYLDSREKRLSDSDMFYGLLLDSGIQFDSINLGAELPFAENAIHKLHEADTVPNPLGNTLSCISMLDLRLECGWDQIGLVELSPYRGLLRCAGNSLKHLKISLTPNLAFKTPRLESRLAQLLDIIFPKLESLEISFEDSSVTTGKGQKRGLRPTCQLLDIVEFLSRHLVTLTAIRLTNVVFSHYHQGYCDVLESTRRAVQMLRKSNEMQNIEWSINRYVHDPRCRKRDHEDTTACRKFQCGRYDPSPNTLLTYQDFEVLAIELGVELDKTRGRWDFGGVSLGDCITDKMMVQEPPQKDILALVQAAL